MMAHKNTARTSREGLENNNMGNNIEFIFVAGVWFCIFFSGIFTLDWLSSKFKAIGKILDKIVKII